MNKCKFLSFYTEQVVVVLKRHLLRISYCMNTTTNLTEETISLHMETAFFFFFAKLEQYSHITMKSRFQMLTKRIQS